MDFHHILLAGLPAHSLALRPAHLRRHLYVTCYTEGFSHFVTSMTAPVASGWSGCRVGLAPTGKRRLVTAHTLFYQSVFNTRGADAQLGGMLNSALRRALSEASITDIVRDKRDALMADIRDQMIAGAKRFGLGVVDVRIKRADLPSENSEAVFRRMQTERQQRAASYRAQGSNQSQQIKAEADRKVTVITAQAQQQSEQIRGEGDGERNRIFAEAYGADPEFFAFYRSMQAYQNSFNNGQSRALISPKSDFFRYFSTPTPPPEAPSAQSPAAQSPAAAAKAD